MPIARDIEKIKKKKGFGLKPSKIRAALKEGAIEGIKAPIRVFKRFKRK